MALGILVGLLRGGRAVPKSGIGALTSKRGPRNFYKGKGCKSTGRHTSKGFFLSCSLLFLLCLFLRRFLSDSASVFLFCLVCIRFSLARYLLSGAYVLMEEKLPKYVVPDLTNCKVRGFRVSLEGFLFRFHFLLHVSGSQLFFGLRM
jgi:hypothetical protein